MTADEEWAYQHLISQLWDENKELKKEVIRLGRLLIKQKAKQLRHERSKERKRL